MTNLGFLEKFYIDIASHISKIVDAEEKPYFKTIDLWNEQWANLKDEPAFAFPALFIEFASLPYKSIGNKVQTSEAIIKLHIGSKTLKKSKFVSIETPPAGISHLRLIDTLHYWMSRISGDNFSTFQRIATEPDQDHNDLIAHVETYRCFVKDASSMPVYVQHYEDMLKIVFE